MENQIQMEEKNEYRIWLLSLGIMLALLSDGAWILMVVALILIGLGAFQIWQVHQAKKSS